MITSQQNDHIKHVRSLQGRRHARRKYNQFVIEGVNLCEEAVQAGAHIESVFYTADYAEGGTELIEALGKTGASLIEVDNPVMASMSDTQSPQGILCVLPFLDLEPPEETTYTLIIDGINDPGNLGTIMRTAAAAGVKSFILTSGTVDLYNPKVVRSAMGAHFRLPIQQYSWEGIASRLADQVIFLADISGGANYDQVDWTQLSALIVSDEAHGPSEDAYRVAHAHVTIPMPGKFDSLNVAMAAGIMIFEMVRQRSQG